MIPDDRDLPHVRGDECPRCHAFDGEPHGLRCADAASDDDTVAPATCGPVGVDADGREVTPPHARGRVPRKDRFVIAIYQRTASGVVRADTATTVAESHASLRRIGPPAVAYDGSVFVAAAGGTSASDLRAITAVATAGAEPEARSCAWPGCCAHVARVREMTPIGLVGFCGAHRRLIYECSRPVDTDDPDAVARLVERVGPLHCSKDRCPWCRADLRRAVAELTRRAA